MPNHNPITPDRSAPIRIVETVFPGATNHYGTMFGGKVLELMDRAAFLAASRFAQQAMVTASTERIDFHHPIKHGHMVEAIAHVVHTGRTSLTVRVSLYAEDPLRATREHATDGYFHMVAVDADGKPTSVPTLVAETPEAKAEWEFVAHLKASRLRRAHA
ncbi:acyl-CoA thioesterase [bacterium]|nr:acyl-CoA thioesterase [bacterium]